MSRRLVVSIVIATAFVSTASAAFAFNGKRGGFILGFGAGASMTSYKYRYDSGFTQDASSDGTSDRESKFGIGTDFKIGGGFNDQFLLYYVNRVAWFKDGVTLVHSVGLLGASYYLKTEAPAWYIVGAIGMSTWDAPFESNSTSLTGFGLTGGVGYEFTKHWSLEATLNWGKPSENDTEVNAISVMVTVFGLAY
jgi:opacity protein-like surface antigen